MIRAVLHVHTKYSLDTSIGSKSLVGQFSAHSTIKVIAVIDHDASVSFLIWEVNTFLKGHKACLLN